MAVFTMPQYDGEDTQVTATIEVDLNTANNSINNSINNSVNVYQYNYTYLRNPIISRASRQEFASR